MKIHIPYLIIGAGYSGLILQHELKKKFIPTVIIERGYRHGYAGDNYVVFTKSEFDFTDGEIDVEVSKINSGIRPFDLEYSEKVYNKKRDVKLFSEEEHTESIKGYSISSDALLKDSQIYGNIEITSIDLTSKIAYGNVLHINKKAEFHYNALVSTIPIHEFCKLSNINPFNDFGLFISYFPIGIKMAKSSKFSKIMRIEYISDPSIPFYRKQIYRNTIYYEYCLNKPFDEKFTSVIVPGKFISPNNENLLRTYSYFEGKSVFMLGRFSVWHPDFLLDHICEMGAGDGVFKNHIRSMYNRIK